MAYERSVYSDMYTPNNMFGVTNTNAANNLNNQMAKVYDKNALTGAGANWAGYGFGANDELEAMENYFQEAQGLRQGKLGKGKTPGQLRTWMERQQNIPFGGGLKKRDINMDLVPKDFLINEQDFIDQKSPYSLFGKGDQTKGTIEFDPNNVQVNKASMIPEGFIDKMKSLFSGGVNNTNAANAFNNTVAPNMTGITGAYRPNMRDISGEVGEYGNTSGFDLSNMDNPDAAIGPMINFKDAPVEWNEKLKGLQMNNPRYGLIDQFRNQGGDETTGMFAGLRDKLGMTQVSDPDRTANKQFMQEQGIGRDPQTGRMIGGDFAGKNAPGTSMFGSKNFDEMRGKWVDEYGDMDYTTKKQKDKRDRLVKEEADYQAKIIADKAAADAAKAAPATGGDWRPSQPGGATLSQLQSPAGNYAAATARTSSRVGPGGNVRAYGLAQGGRVGYNEGGRVGILSVF